MRLNVLILGIAGGVQQANTNKTPTVIPITDSNGGLTLGPTTLDSLVLNGPVTNNAVVNVSASGTLTSAVLTFVDCTAGNIVLTLPAASTFANQEFNIVRTDTSGNTLHLAPSGTDELNNSTSNFSVTNGITHIVSNGAASFAR